MCWKPKLTKGHVETALLNSLEGAYEKPTALELSTYQDLKALAVEGEAKLEALTMAQ